MAQIVSTSYVITVSKIVKSNSDEPIVLDGLEASLEAITQELVGEAHLVEVIKAE